MQYFQIRLTISGKLSIFYGYVSSSENLSGIPFLVNETLSNTIVINCSFISTTCSTTSDYVLKALPTISSEYVEFAEKLKSTFTGDPSFFAFNGDEEETQQDEEVLFHHQIYYVPKSHSNSLCMLSSSNIIE